MKRILCALGIAAGVVALAASARAQDAPPVSDAGRVSTPDRPIVVVETSLGSFEIELRPDRAPVSVENFLRYVDDGYYDGTIFHRVIGGVLIHAAGYEADLSRRPPREPIANEATNGLMNDRWTVAMDREHEIGSADSGWFVNLSDNVTYNHRGPDPSSYGFAVFGRVVAGRDVVEQIAAVQTVMRRPHQKVPIDPVKLVSIRRK